MRQKPWWEVHGGRLEYELEALDKAGIRCRKDKDAFAAGIVQLWLTLVHEGEELELRVVFPDLYPYFRFEIYAAKLDLPHHQNPFAKNLCLIGRSTEFWHTNDTLADFIVKRLPQTLTAGRSDDRQEVAGLEQHQAEPYSNYFICHPGTSVIVDGGWKIDTCYESGTVLLGIASGDSKLISGAVLKVLTEHGMSIAEADAQIVKAYSEKVHEVRWVRLAKAPKTAKPGKLFELLHGKDPYPDKGRKYRVDGGRLQMRAALFPEEINNWRQLGYGWLFVCELDIRKSWQKKQEKRGK